MADATAVGPAAGVQMGAIRAVWKRKRLGRALPIRTGSPDRTAAHGQAAVWRPPTHLRFRLDARRAIAAVLRPLPHFAAWRTSHAATTAVAGGRSDVEYALSREELQLLLPALREGLGWRYTPLDSPARLEEALGALVTGLGGHADVNVRRSPATLMTPEYWHIRFQALDRRTHDALEPLLGRERP